MSIIICAALSYNCFVGTLFSTYW